MDGARWTDDDGIISTPMEGVHQLLGVNSQLPARRLAKVLLADPLSAKNGREQLLDDPTTDDGRVLLLRYDEASGVSTENALLVTHFVPSPLLKSYNVEILISSVDPNQSAFARTDPVISPARALLAPTLEVKASSTGRQFTHVTYPVHKALVFGTGIRDYFAVGRLMGGGPDESEATDTVSVAFDMPRAELASKKADVDLGPAIDTTLASFAIDEFRRTPENATRFEEGWFQSGMPTLVSWLTEGLASSGQRIPPVIRRLILSVLVEASGMIDRADADGQEALRQAWVPDSIRREGHELLGRWAQHAHAELRDELDRAFNGTRWRRLKWWKLLWRIDDVGMVASEVLNGSWLVHAEKEIIWLAGRIEGGGFFRDLRRTAPPVGSVARPRMPASEFDRAWSRPGSTEASATAAGLATEDDRHASVLHRQPWPIQISTLRDRLLRSSVPSLESRGQVWLLESLSTAVLSSTLAALVYVTWSSVSLYQAGAIAVFGTTLALWRLQRDWEHARRGWEGDIREEGRKALKDTQDAVATVLDTDGRPLEVAEDVEARQAARAAVDAARQALSQLR
ncbi:MAG: hypothetical protein M1826_007321 [Phylliscum demangeonii]|nr:MAG: hypothetical protein M1826_007321 [Phylliscum demangeonii]